MTEQWLAPREDYQLNKDAFYRRVEEKFEYPLIAKPVDDGCSSAVKLLRTRAELAAYCQLTFQPGGKQEEQARRALRLGEKEEWPLGKGTILFESAITAEGAEKFLEITGGNAHPLRRWGTSYATRSSSPARRWPAARS